jgi:hypothetical protein
MNQTSPTTSQPDAIQSDPDVMPNHPLAAIAGKFEGELWDATLAEIQRLRRLDPKKLRFGKVRIDWADLEILDHNKILLISQHLCEKKH